MRTIARLGLALGILFLAAASAGCRDKDSTSNAAPAVGAASGGASVAAKASTSANTAGPAADAPLPKLTATSAGIALGNLDAQIDSLQKQPPDPAVRRGLIDVLLSRGQLLGKIADYERAATLAEQLVKDLPKDPESFLTRAATLSTFHRFDAALADLAKAEELGARRDKVASSRAAIFEATGRYDEALALMRHDEGAMTPTELASAGVLAGEMGKLGEANRLIDAGREKYPDVSPFPLAWMDAQQASLLERRGDLLAARSHYVRATTLLPPFARAAAHLAALANPDEAVAMLTPLLKTSDDPEVEVQLAEALGRLDRKDEAKQHLDNAIARYDALLAKHPEAFADHAAVMWLGPGKNPARALPLAKTNAQVRRTSESLELWLSAARAAHDEGEACAAARAASSFAYPTDGLRTMATSIVARCPVAAASASASTKP